MRSAILILLSLPLLFSCSGQEELTVASGQPENIPAGISRITFRSGPMPKCVYVFRKEGNEFRYNSTLDSGWTDEGKLTTRLLIGDYKFLCTAPLEGQVDVLPTPLDKTVTFEQLRFVSQADAEHPGNILPVEELFLPEPDVAGAVYTIRGGDEIEWTLKRGVSQLVFVLNRGYKEGDEYVPQPYAEGHNIFETIEEIRVEISGVGRECNYLGTSGEGTVSCSYTASGAESINSHGFATISGPFVFPPADDGDVHLAITLVPVSGEACPALQLTSKLEANRKLMVNLWFGSSYFDIGVTTRNLPISDRTDGDLGGWE
ncbi:MAG: FimB/Mfa2 family fimbrial subunit [Bacteroides sp.]|nr:FimB/Mfa2 family fimbrial subunit [Bacteroides sp.]